MFLDSLLLYYDPPSHTLRFMYPTAASTARARQQQIECEAKLFGGTPPHSTDPSCSMKLQEYLSYLDHAAFNSQSHFAVGMLAPAVLPASGDRAALVRP